MAQRRRAFESRYGRLGSGASRVRIAGATLELGEVMRWLGLDFEGNRVIDAPDVGTDRHAIRYFDGEERRIVCCEFAADFSFIEEHRVHVAEWLGDASLETAHDARSPVEPRGKVG